MFRSMISNTSLLIYMMLNTEEEQISVLNNMSLLIETFDANTQKYFQITGCESYHKEEDFS